ncbi:hypothetical protein RRF57_009704 [Xylaria bambusicola]|uniref:Uncharacterized protein n=1 Tax=Xylaria bambusicola TaxID=326684 RepID=A0AAN7UK25_9PEZI
MSRTDNPFNRSNVIILEDDDSSIELSYVEQGLRRLKHACQTGQSVSLACIDLTRDEETQRNVHDYEKDIIGELDGLGRSRSSHCRQPAPSRNPPTQLRAEIPSFRHNTMLLKTGTVVEVSPRPQNEYCWQFLRIIRLYVDFRSRNIILQGVRLTRTRHLRGMLPRMKNEVCALYDINRQNPRPENAQGLVETTVGEVVRTRAVSKTNDAFPTHRFNPAQWDWNMDAIENSGNLVQRWKFCRYWPTSTAMETKRSYSGALIRLRSTDIEDEHFRVADDQLRNIFRGGIIRGGSWTGGQVHLPIVNSEAPQDKNKRVTLGYNQKYTADDMFCGAGGASR